MFGLEFAEYTLGYEWGIELEGGPTDWTPLHWDAFSKATSTAHQIRLGQEVSNEDLLQMIETAINQLGCNE